MGFERCHPAVNLLYFTAVLTGTLVFRHPLCLLISFLCAFVYSVMRGGQRALIFNVGLLPPVILFALYYASYNHFGVTVLRQNAVGNNITLESLVYGLVLGTAAAGVCMWFSCVYSVFTTDKVVYLFGRISPRLALFLAILLRTVPRTKREMQRMHTARCGIGRGVKQGTLLNGFLNGVRIFSMLITWLIEALSAAAQSMKSRGSRLRGRKAFSVYRFDDRDRGFAIVLFSCLTLTAMGWFLGMTAAVYDPQIRVVWPEGVSVLFYLGYLALCLLPPVLELWTAYRFRRARKGIWAKK